MIPEAYKLPAAESLKDLRLSLIAAGLPEATVRTVTYDWLVRTADRFMPGDAAAAKAIVDAALRELRGDVSTPPPVVITPGSGKLKTLAAPGWFAGPVNFWYNADPAALAARLAQNGALGQIIEFRGAGAQFGVDGVPGFDELLKRARLVADALAAHGLWLWFIDGNWNSPYKANRIEQFRSEADAIKAALNEFSNILIQPVSEKGSTKNVGNQEAKARQLFAHYEKIFSGPMAWYCSGAEKCPPRYQIADYHVSGTGKIGGKAGSINTTSTDHGQCLAELHGGDYKGQKADVSKLVAHAQRAWTAGQIYVWYEFFHRSPQWESYDALGAAFAKFATPSQDNPVVAGSADALDISGATMLSKHRRHNVAALPIVHTLQGATTGKASMKYEGTPSDWKKTNGIDARCYIFWRENGRTYGGHFEWHEPGHDSRELKNIFGGYLDGKRPPSGAEVFYCLADNGDMQGSPSKRTNVVAGGRFP